MSRLFGCLLALLLFLPPLPAVAQDANSLSDRAIERYRQALAIDPGNLPLHYYLGVTLLIEGRDREAVNEFRSAYPGFADSIEANYNFALAYSRLRDPDSALIYLQRAEDLGADRQPDLFPLTDIYFNLALAYIDDDQPEDAIRLLHKVIARTGGGNSEARRLLGDLYLKQGQIEQASEQWQKVLASNPDDSLAREALYSIRFNTGLKALQEQRPEDARDSFLAAMKLEPESALCGYYLGYLSYQENHYAEAIDRLVKAAPEIPEDMQPSLSAMVYNSAAALLEAGQPEAARKAANYLAGSAKTESQAHYLTGNIHLALKDFTLARKEYLKVLEADPTHVGANLNLQKADQGTSEELYQQGRALYREGDLAGAISKLEAALRINPGHGMARAYLDQSRRDIEQESLRLLAAGRTALQGGDPEQALAKARKVLALVPGSAPARDLERLAAAALGSNINQLLAKAGDLQQAGSLLEAEKTYLKILQLAPDNQSARQGLDTLRAERRDRVATTLTRANQALDAGSLGEARQLFTSVLDHDPQNRDARDGLERTEALVSSLVTEELHWARRARQSGHYNKAREHYSRALRLRPSSEIENETAELERAATRKLEQLLLAVDTAVGQNQFNRARNLLAKAEAVAPGAPAIATRQRDLEADIALRLRNNLATAKRASAAGDQQAALSAYRRILDLDPGNDAALKGLEQSRKALAGRLKTLVSSASEAINKGDYAAAEVALRQARTMDPYNPAARTQLERLATIRRNDLKPRDAQQLYLHGIEAYTGGHYQDAIRAWKQVLILQPEHEKARLNIEKARRKLAQLKAYSNG